MRSSIDSTRLDAILGRCAQANKAFQRSFPGEPHYRQPVHTVYGGAHLYKAETTARLGELALQAMDLWAPGPVSFAHALQLPGHQELPAQDDGAEDTMSPGDLRRAHPARWFAHAVWSRTRAKLQREAVEDFRIDFEDGYGNRSDAEEDAEAVRAAQEVARASREGRLPPFIGIRVKPMTEEHKRRSMRTVDLFLSALVDALAGSPLPALLITLPKVQVAEQVTAFVDGLAAIEAANQLTPGTFAMEFMVEVTQAIVGADGRSPTPAFSMRRGGGVSPPTSGPTTSRRRPGSPPATRSWIMACSTSRSR